MNAKKAFALAMKARREVEEAKKFVGQSEELKRLRELKKRDDQIEELTKIIKELIYKAAKEGQLKIEFDVGKLYYPEDVTFSVMMELEYEGYCIDCIEERSYYPCDDLDNMSFESCVTDFLDKGIRTSNTKYDASIYSISWENVGSVQK